MKMYELPAGTRIEVIEHDMLVHVDCRQWNQTESTRDSFFENDSFVDGTNAKNSNFPHFIKEMVNANKNLVVMRSYHKGKVYYAKATVYQLNYIG